MLVVVVAKATPEMMLDRKWCRSIVTIDLISRTNKQRQRAIEGVEVERAPLHSVTSVTP